MSANVITFLAKWPMEEGQRNYWLGQLSNELSTAVANKFKAGQAAHGGTDLGQVVTEQVLDESLEEVLDLLCYLAELKRRMIPHGDGVYVKRKGVKALLTWFEQHPPDQDDPDFAMLIMDLKKAVGVT